MSIHALLGATGATGSSILRYLLANPPKDLHLRILVRNKTKLLKAFPDLEATKAFKLEIIEANLDDKAAFQQCLTDVEVIYMCIATNESTRGITVAQDAATNIFAALRALKSQQKAYKKPTALVIRSTTLNPILSKYQAWLLHHFVRFAIGFCYDDLEAAATLYHDVARDEQLLDYIFVDPPAIHDADGTERTGYELVLDAQQSPTLSYADLGAAFVEIGQRRGEFAGKGVGVSATGKVNEDWPLLMGYMRQGLWARFFG